jgi:hypothetical protein
MLCQKMIEGVSASTSESSVTLVVLKLLIASKVDSKRLAKVAAIRNGAAPGTVVITQASVTER